MVDVWSSWDERVQASGQPARVARELTNAELLNLLAARDPEREVEKRLLKEEAGRRMRAQDPARPASSSPRSTEPAGAAPQPGQGTAEPTRPGYLDPF